MSIYEVANIFLDATDGTKAVEWTVRKVPHDTPTETDRKVFDYGSFTFQVTRVYAKLNMAVEHGITFLAQSGQMVAAVGVTRGCTSLGLKEAKLLAEWLRDNR